MRVPTHGAVLGHEEDLALLDVVRRRWYTEGEACHKFARKLAAYTGMRDVTLTNSGSSANLLALSTLAQPELGERRILPGDEVITTALNFPTTVAPIVQIGAAPVFVDVDLPGMISSVDTILGAVTDRTAAIVLAHTLGNPAPIRELRAALGNKLWLVEDCCDALGSPKTFEADIATLSFFPAHQITTGEGGAMLTRSPMLGKLARSLRDWGKDCWCPPGKDNVCGTRFDGEYDHKYTFARLGYNLKMTEFAGALGAAQMDKLPGFVRARDINHTRLNVMMVQAGMDEYFILPPFHSASWFGFALICKPPIDRRDITRYLEGKDIQTRPVFGGNLLRQPGFRDIPHRVIGDLRNTNTVHDSAFWVGCWPGLDDAQLNHIVNSIVEYCRRVI